MLLTVSSIMVLPMTTSDECNHAPDAPSQTAGHVVELSDYRDEPIPRDRLQAAREWDAYLGGDYKRARMRREKDALGVAGLPPTLRVVG